MPRKKTGPARSDKPKAPLVEIEEAFAHLVAAIKQGVVTVSTKAELVKLEGEQQRLQQVLERSQSKTPDDYAGLYRLVTSKNKFGGGEGS
ncbi:MAG: hypothetical protein OJF51_003054 [Nitrospira sp.]|nr:MAG: hypothetical protein OJF51_003054 [Nitrospira sp.]